MHLMRFDDLIRGDGMKRKRELDSILIGIILLLAEIRIRSR